jgi:hypothetical protein
MVDRRRDLADDSPDRPDGSLPLYAADSVGEVTAAIDHLAGLGYR